MIERITTRGFELDDPARAALERVFPGLPWARASGPSALRLRVDLDAWVQPDFDPSPLDWSLDGRSWDEPVALVLSAAEPPATATLLEVLTRFQRLLDRRNPASATPLFARVLRTHRTLHDLALPLVRADYEHAVDTWRWVLRLAPDAGLALQLAALMHDIERLWSEPRRRVEQHARDYEAFKREHARRGAALLGELLRPLGLPPATLEQVLRLVAAHERPGEHDRDAGAEAEAPLLRDADALSFFSLNAPGFLDCFGPAHGRRKVAYTLERLSPARRPLLAQLRHRADVAALLAGSLAAAGSEAA